MITQDSKNAFEDFKRHAGLEYEFDFECDAVTLVGPAATIATIEYESCARAFEVAS